MGAHVEVVETRNGFRAECDCGYRSPLYKPGLGAQQAAERHQDHTGHRFGTSGSEQ